MSIKIMSKVWEQSSHEGSPLLLLLALADHASDDGVCWPGIPRLAHKTRKTERHTKRLLVKLEESGEVYIAREVGRGNTNMYYITLGFDKEEMVHTLIKRFEFEPGEASRIAQQIIERQIKGDIQDTFSGDGEDEKGDIQGQEKVTPRAEKVTLRDGKGDKAMSPESSLTVIEPSVRNRQKDSDFPENPNPPVPPAPSPGGGPQSVKLRLTREKGKPHVVVPDEVEQEILADIADSGKETDDDMGHSRTSDTGAAPDSPDCAMDKDSLGVAPDMWDLARRTAAARAEAGNWADPAQAGGDDAVAFAALEALYDGEPPNPESGIYTLAMEKLGLVLAQRGVRDVAVGRKAGELMREANRKSPAFLNPALKTFESAFDVFVAEAQKRDGKPSDRAARYDTPAVRASQAAFEERMAARDPPVEGDPIWEAAKREIALQMTRVTFDTWVRDTYGLPQQDGVYTVMVPDKRARDWLDDRLKVTAQRTLVGILDEQVEVRFEVQPEEVE